MRESSAGRIKSAQLKFSSQSKWRYNVSDTTPSMMMISKKTYRLHNTEAEKKKN